MLQHGDAQPHTAHKSAKRITTKLLHVRGNIHRDVLCVTAGISIAAGSDGICGDVRSMETVVSKFGDGSEATGSMVIWNPTGVSSASADSDVSGSGPHGRDCTRQVSHVVRYFSAKDRHNAIQRMQSGIC